MTAVDDVVDAATSSGATNVQGISFRVDDQAAAEAEARTAAVADAKVRADQLASDAGVSIVGIISITEAGTNPAEPVFLGGDTTGGGKGGTTATPVLPGQVEVTVTVSIDYEIESLLVAVSRQAVPGASRIAIAGPGSCRSGTRLR